MVTNQQNGSLVEMSHQKANAEPPAASLKDARTETDQVKEDGIMKELFKKEEETRESWEAKWGFMKNPGELWRDEARRRGLPACIFSGGMPRSKAISPTWAERKMENINLKGSRKISEKSSGMIGWRSSVMENDYNRLVGPLYESPKLTIYPPLGEDEPDPRKQRFIFLG